MTLTTATVDAQVLSDTVADLADRVDSTVRNAVAEISSTTGALLDEKHGNLPVALRQFTNELDGLLGKEFDPDSKASIIGKIESVVRGAVTAQVVAMERMLDRASPTAISVVSRMPSGGPCEPRHQPWRSKSVNSRNDSRRSEPPRQPSRPSRRKHRQRVRVRGRSAQLPRTTRRCAARPGRTDRQQLRPDREQAWRRSHHTQCRRHKRRRRTVRHRGQEPTHVQTQDLRRTRPSTRQPRRNRRHRRVRQPRPTPTTVPFTDYGNKAILQLDGADPDPHLIRFAYIWARGSPDEHSPTPPTTSTLPASTTSSEPPATRSAARSQIRGLHTKSRTAIDEATTLLNTLDSSVKTVLDQLESAICVAPR